MKEAPGWDFGECGCSAAEVAEDELGAGQGGVVHGVGGVVEPEHGAIGAGDADQQQGEGELQGDAADDGAPGDAAAVLGAQEGEQQQRCQAQRCPEDWGVEHVCQAAGFWLKGR